MQPIKPVQPARLRGFNDLAGASARMLTLVEDAARAVMERYSVSEIRIPLLERVDLYERSSGVTSDIVEKQMYSFADQDESRTTVVMRPEGTPGVVRAYINAGYDRTQARQRFFYSGPMFRRERPQKGRYRQFYQFGAEIFGRADPDCDAELLVMIDDIRRELNLRTGAAIGFEFQLNSLGCSVCRPRFREALLEFGRAHLSELCEDCHRRLEKNPLRLLDCKIDVNLAPFAPTSIEFLCEECRTHFAKVQELAAAAGLAPIVNPRLVRGLDYYMRTAFEVMAAGLGAQNTAVAGGRYDGLVEALGGAAVPGIGFGMGVDRMALALDAALKDAGRDPRLDPALESKNRRIIRAPEVAIAALGDAARARGFVLAHELRAAGLRTELLTPGRRLKAQLDEANTLGARFAAILGDGELERAVVQLRDLAAGEQREVKLADLAAALTEGRG